MVVAEADLALETRVLAVLVSGLALQGLGLDDLTGGLVLELVVLAEVRVAERADEDPASVLPHAAVALDADGQLS